MQLAIHAIILRNVCGQQINIWGSTKPPVNSQKVTRRTGSGEQAEVDENNFPEAGDKWWGHSTKSESASSTGDTWKRQANPYGPVPPPDQQQNDNLNSEAMKVASKQAELQSLLQQIYQAEAAVKMETGEVTRTQQVAAEAEQALEEATNKVRLLSADLQAAQEAAAQAAMRAHTAQLQLSAHDQLMFTARQRVDALSAQMVSVQAELASAQQMFTLTNSSQHLEAQAKNFQLPFLQEAPSESQGMDQYGSANTYLQESAGGASGGARWPAPSGQAPGGGYYPAAAPPQQNFPQPSPDNAAKPYYLFN